MSYAPLGLSASAAPWRKLALNPLAVTMARFRLRRRRANRLSSRRSSATAEIAPREMTVAGRTEIAVAVSAKIHAGKSSDARCVAMNGGRIGASNAGGMFGRQNGGQSAAATCAGLSAGSKDASIGA